MGSALTGRDERVVLVHFAKGVDAASGREVCGLGGGGGALFRGLERGLERTLLSKAVLQGQVGMTTKALVHVHLMG